MPAHSTCLPVPAYYLQLPPVLTAVGAGTRTLLHSLAKAFGITLQNICLLHAIFIVQSGLLCLACLT